MPAESRLPILPSHARVLRHLTEMDMTYQQQIRDQIQGRLETSSPMCRRHTRNFSKWGTPDLAVQMTFYRLLLREDQKKFHHAINRLTTVNNKIHSGLQSAISRTEQGLAVKIASPCFFWCRRGDSNPYTLSSTAPSRQRVYQFHHFGTKFMARCYPYRRVWSHFAERPRAEGIAARAPAPVPSTVRQPWMGRNPSRDPRTKAQYRSARK